jgi:hypothetical protein
MPEALPCMRFSPLNASLLISSTLSTFLSFYIKITSKTPATPTQKAALEPIPEPTGKLFSMKKLRKQGSRTVSLTKVQITPGIVPWFI